MQMIINIIMQSKVHFVDKNKLNLLHLKFVTNYRTCVINIIKIIYCLLNAETVIGKINNLKIKKDWPKTFTF